MHIVYNNKVKSYIYRIIIAILRDVPVTVIREVALPTIPVGVLPVQV